MAAASAAQYERRSIAVVLEEPKQHIPDFSLDDRLNDALSMYAGLNVIVAEADYASMEFPDKRFDLERLINWAREADLRYVIYVQIDYRRIVTSKKWSIPLILSRYVVEGQLVGAYSLIDTQRRKPVNTWNLDATVKGPQQWQVVDDYPDDPDLHISAPKKIAFLKRLEDLAAAQIIRSVVPNLKGR
jgi:hypothetical protein